MSMKEVVDLMLFPPVLKDVALIAVILSIVQISPLKLSPWDWLKSFIQLPKRLEKLEHEFNDDRAFRWRSMIISRADKVEDGRKLRREVWKDTMETINNYELYCEHNKDFRNELASQTIEYLRRKYQEVKETHDYWKGEE